jgi:hypothetical protein
MANPEHVEIGLQPEEWKRWWTDHPDSSLDLRADFGGDNLKGANGAQ